MYFHTSKRFPLVIGTFAFPNITALTSVAVNKIVFGMLSFSQCYCASVILSNIATTLIEII